MNRAEFKRRRKQLMRMMGNDSIAILPAASESVRNRDVYYRYRPDSDFYYLTGFHEPDAVAVLIPGRKHAEYILFCRPHDKTKAMWDGVMAGQDAAPSSGQALAAATRRGGSICRRRRCVGDRSQRKRDCAVVHWAAGVSDHTRLQLREVDRGCNRDRSGTVISRYRDHCGGRRIN